MNSPLLAARYHSLAATRLPDVLDSIAVSADGTVMAVEHRSAPIFGLQFHPESILTPNGRSLLANAIELIAGPGETANAATA